MGRHVDCVARLAALVGVPDQRRNDVDWPAVESSVGLRLPDDYRRLVETFPDGIFQGLVRVNRPGDHHESAKEFLGFYAWQLEDMRQLRASGHAFPYPIFPEPGGLLPWATGPRAEPFFWLTRGEDPNMWPVAAASHDLTGWQEFPGTACQVLVDVVEGRFDASLFGVDLSGRGPWFNPIEEEERAGGSGAAPPLLSSSGRTVNEYSTLAGMIGASPGATHRVDWAHVQEFMGVALPGDYRSFIDTYGPGTFGEIKITAPGAPGGFDLYHLLRRAIDTGRSPDTVRTVPICPEPGGIIAWGETEDGWTFSWSPADPDPDRWSVVMYNRALLWHLADRSFSQFLCRYAEGAAEIADILGRNVPLVTPVRFVPAKPRLDIS
jgi:hypothetical protein